MSLYCDWAFLKSLICEKAENKSVTCDRGRALIHKSGLTIHRWNHKPNYNDKED